MTQPTPRIKVAILDDYQNVALTMADWSPLRGLADITVFDDHVGDSDALVDRQYVPRADYRYSSVTRCA